MGITEYSLTPLYHKAAESSRTITAERITDLQIPKYHAKIPKYQIDTLKYVFLLPNSDISNNTKENSLVLFRILFRI